MNSRLNPFEELASRCRAGDLTAKAQFHHQMQSRMVHIVRRTLLVKKETTTMDRQILATARAMGLEDKPTSKHHRESIIQEVAHRLCRQVMETLKPVTDHCYLTTVNLGINAWNRLPLESHGMI